MTARDVIDGVFIERSKQNEPVSADAILAALAADGWRVVRLEERRGVAVNGWPDQPPQLVITEEAT